MTAHENGYFKVISFHFFFFLIKPIYFSNGRAILRTNRNFNCANEILIEALDITLHIQVISVLRKLAKQGPRSLCQYYT